MIPYGRHKISDVDIQCVVKSLQSDWLTIGPLVEQFEAEIEKITGSSAVSVNSGTAALHCAYAAINLEKGDEVITPPITFIATQATAAFFGAKIVFADVMDDTGNIDPESVEEKITSNTKAIVAVDFAGHPADMHELRKIADKYGLYLLEDASHSLGSVYHGKSVGTLADITTFSFFPTKNITTAEGGAICSQDIKLLKSAKQFARQGVIRSIDDFKLEPDGPWHQEVHNFGLNYRLPDVLCALGISQIKKLSEFKVKRTEMFNFYNSALSNLAWLKTPAQREFVDPFWHLYPIRVDAELRKNLYTYLRKSDIGVQVNYIPAYRHPVFESLRINPRLYPNSESFYRSELSIPFHLDLTPADLEYIVVKIKDFEKTL